MARDTGWNADIEIPSFLRRGDPKVEAAANRAWDVRWERLRLEADRKAQMAKAAKQTEDTKVKTTKAKAADVGETKPTKGSKPEKAGKATSKGDKPEKKAPRESKVVRDQYGFKEGSKKSQAAELYARKEGATLEEVKAELDSSQLNLLRDLEKEGWKVRKEKEKGDGKKSVTRYFLGKKS